LLASTDPSVQGVENGSPERSPPSFACALSRLVNVSAAHILLGYYRRRLKLNNLVGRVA
jgi:hypothetical protein